MSEAVTQLHEKLNRTTGRDRLPVLIELAFALHETDAHEGLRTCQEGQQLAEQFGDLRAKTTLRLMEAFNLERLGAYEHALSLVDQAQPLIESVGDVDMLARSWNIRGVILSSLGRFDDALHYLLLSMGTLEETGAYWGLCAILTNLGIAYDRLGRHDVAYRYHQRALKLSVSIGRFNTQLSAVTNLGSNRLHIGEFQESLNYSREALSLARAQGHAYVEVIATGNMAEAYSGLGQPDNAHAYFDAAIRQARRMEASESLVDVLYQKSKLCLTSGHTAQAIDLIQEALPVVDQMGGFYLETTYRVHLAEAQLAHGQPQDAMRSLTQALQRPSDREASPALSRANLLLSRLYQEAGEPDLAEVYQRHHEDAERAIRDQTAAWSRAIASAEQQAEDRKRAQGTNLPAHPLPREPEGGARPPVHAGPTQSRPAFLHRLDEQLEHARRRFEDLALFVVAVDPPRHDSELHSDVADVIERVLRRELQKVERLGPNFVMVVRASPRHATEVAGQLVQQVRDLHRSGSPESRVTISIGCCTTTAWSQPEDMLMAGERLLRQAQGLGGNRVMTTPAQST